MKKIIRKYKIGDEIHLDQLYVTDISGCFIPKDENNDLDDFQICCQDVTIIIFKGKCKDREEIKKRVEK